MFIKLFDYIKGNKKVSVTLTSILFAVLVGCVSYYLLGPDNIIEEKCEEIIKKDTGLNIDLSPSTPEKKILKEEMEKVEDAIYSEKSS